MSRSRMRYLPFSLMLFCSCASEYKGLHSIDVDRGCVAKMIPKGIQTSWYTASVDVIGKHLSGLLFLKNMPDHSNRIVFMNEAGVTFFDFEFDSVNRFAVKQIVPQLDRRPVIRLLADDFRLMMGLPFERGRIKAWSGDGTVYYGVTEKSESHYFITDTDCASLQRLETGSKRKRKVTVLFHGPDRQLPDSIELLHHTFAMNIALRKLTRN